jgi:hypothetical protein
MRLHIRSRILFISYSIGVKTQVWGELDGPAPGVVAGDDAECM